MELRQHEPSGPNPWATETGKMARRSTMDSNPVFPRPRQPTIDSSAASSQPKEAKGKSKHVRSLTMDPSTTVFPRTKEVMNGSKAPATTTIEGRLRGESPPSLQRFAGIIPTFEKQPQLRWKSIMSLQNGIKRLNDEIIQCDQELRDLISRSQLARGPKEREMLRDQGNRQTNELLSLQSLAVELKQIMLASLAQARFQGSDRFKLDADDNLVDSEGVALSSSHSPARVSLDGNERPGGSRVIAPAPSRSSDLFNFDRDQNGELEEVDLEKAPRRKSVPGQKLVSGKDKDENPFLKEDVAEKREEAWGMTPEMRTRLERERRAKAAEKRIRRMQNGMSPVSPVREITSVREESPAPEAKDAPGVRPTSEENSTQRNGPVKQKITYYEKKRPRIQSAVQENSVVPEEDPAQTGKNAGDKSTVLNEFSFQQAVPNAMERFFSGGSARGGTASADEYESVDEESSREADSQSEDAEKTRKESEASTIDANPSAPIDETSTSTASEPRDESTSRQSLSTTTTTTTSEADSGPATLIQNVHGGQSRAKRFTKSRSFTTDKVKSHQLHRLKKMGKDWARADAFLIPASDAEIEQKVRINALNNKNAGSIAEQLEAMKPKRRGQITKLLEGMNAAEGAESGMVWDVVSVEITDAALSNNGRKDVRAMEVAFKRVSERVWMKQREREREEKGKRDADKEAED